jgi:hypothetical protein
MRGQQSYKIKKEKYYMPDGTGTWQRECQEKSINFNTHPPEISPR